MKTRVRPSSILSCRIQPATAMRLAYAALLGMAVNAGAQTLGVFSNSGALGATDQTALVGLSASKTYLQAIDLGDTVNTTVNGVLFTGSGATGNPSGAGWAFTGTPSRNVGGGTLIPGALGGLTNNFIYGGNPETVTLTGLSVGQTYTITFYNRSFEAAGNRVQTFTASGASTASTVYDEDIGATASGNLNLLRYTFLAGSGTQTLTIAPNVALNTFHAYAFTNEQTFNNDWTGGAAWTTATWSVAQPNGAGSNANFTAQGAPTGITLDAARTVGHVQFDGVNAWTLSGANALTLQGDVGGVSVLSTLAGSHTISTPVVLNSDAVKFGAGTLTLSGAISGTKGLIVNGGTLRFGGTSNVLTYAGGTTVNTGATLDMNGGSQSIGALSGAGTILNNAAGTPISTVTIASGNFTGLIRDNAGASTGLVSIQKTGTGTLTLSGANTFTGLTQISGGVLNVASLSNYGVASAIGARTQAQETAVGNGIGIWFGPGTSTGTLQYTGATPQSTNRDIRVGTGGATFDASGSVPSATLSFTHTGANTNLYDSGGHRTITLTGTNSGANSFSIRLTDQAPSANPATTAAAGLTNLTKSGAGTWFITNSDNTFQGEVIMKSGAERESGDDGSRRADESDEVGRGDVVHHE